MLFSVSDKGVEMIVKMSGGLGNQLFQWATFYALSKKSGIPYFIDLSHYDHNGDHGGFRLDNLQLGVLPTLAKSNSSKHFFEKVICRMCLHWPQVSSVFRKFIHEGLLDSGDLPVIPDGVYMGFWQSHRYFDSCWDDLKKMVIPKKVTPRVQILLEKMEHERVLSVHVRKGDYVTNAKANQTHGVCSLSFYRKALSYMIDVTDIHSVFVFSDDIAMAREELASELSRFENVEFIEGNTQEEDLFLMSRAYHHIIANSSFSWWGAWLGKHKEQVVISPNPWYNIKPKCSSDPSLSTWIRMDK